MEIRPHDRAGAAPAPGALPAAPAGPGSSLGRGQTAALALTLAVAVATAVLHWTGASDLVVFVLGGAALAGLAWIVSLATEAIGERFGPAATGVLQSTLGNLPELFVVLFALAAGEVVVAKTSILGSLFANALLVMGLTFAVGARRAEDGVMRFRERLPNDTATLLMLAVFIIVVLGISDRIGDRASEHQVAISVVGALVLLGVYGSWLASYLRGGRGEPALETAHVRSPLGLVPAIGLLAVAGVAAALVSEYFVDAIDGAAEDLGLSRAFIGLVIVAIAGNAVENVVGVVLAAKGRAELAVSVVKNSVAQIAAFLFPVLVLLSLLFDDRLTFVASPVYVGALALTAIGLWQISGDGKATEFEGYALIALYAVLATLAFYE
jgi:Ca2+:H+ antiporter